MLTYNKDNKYYCASSSFGWLKFSLFPLVWCCINNLRQFLNDLNALRYRNHYLEFYLRLIMLIKSKHLLEKIKHSRESSRVEQRQVLQPLCQGCGSLRKNDNNII